MLFNKDIFVPQYEDESFKYGNQTITVKRYLPIEEKLDLISNIINYSVDENNFYNPCRVEIFEVVEIIFTYTDIERPEDYNAFEVYDAFCSSGIRDTVWEILEECDELASVLRAVHQTIESIYSFKNSTLGIIKAIAEDYENLNIDAEKLQQTIADPENLTLLKNVITKLG